MEIKKGLIAGAKKVVLYGPEGIGKSTFASHFPDPVFIDTEGSTNALDVARFDEDFSDWNKILEAADFVLANPGMKTLVVDTTDWAEQACINFLNEKHRTDNILTMDYGKGSLFVVAEFEKLLNKLTAVVAKGVNVVLLAHAAMRKQELPEEMGAFDRWELKLQSKQVKAMVKEWAHMVLFANYKTMVIEDSKSHSKKAQGGKRVMYTEHHPTWDAKNRYGLDECVEFDYSAIKSIIEGNSPKKTEKKVEKKDPAPAKEGEKKAAKEDPAEEPKQEDGVFAELRALMEANNITDFDVQMAVATLKNRPYDSITPISEYDPAFVRATLVEKFDGLKKKIEKMRETDEVDFN